MTKNIIALLVITCFASSCISTKLTIKNIDENAPALTLLENNIFEIKILSTDKKYGFDQDYPVNLFFQNLDNETINQERFLNALAGPNGENLNYKKLENCCPFPTKKTEMGAGMLEVYEISWLGLPQPKKIYLNRFEKGILMVPVGLTLKK